MLNLATIPVKTANCLLIRSPGKQPVSYALSTAIALAKGGTQPFVMDRAALRLDGLSAYAIVASILLNAALIVYGTILKEVKDTKYIYPNDVSAIKTTQIENIITIVASFSNVICILSAVYTTLVFSLIALYSKTALGLGLDSQFVAFFSATSFLRDSGFRAFISALVSFQISFISAVFLSTSKLGNARWILAWCGIFGSMLSSLSLFQILGSAKSLLFSS